MKVYRWYAEAINMSGITMANEHTTAEDIISEVECYIDNTFDDASQCDDFLISVWPIEDDDNWNILCPTTIAVSY